MVEVDEHGGSQEGNVFIINIIIFRNIVIEDPRPTMQQFFILMEGFKPYFNPEQRRDPGDLNGILFQVTMVVRMKMVFKMMVVKMMMLMVNNQCLQNITKVATSNAMKEPEILWGFNEGKIRNLVG